ncbi:MAG: energy-coupling factor ABC transporter permease [Candidatus Krumholzibacteriota bacterium]|nr:energy-coupling factor ABC transporter permease [Candidatus Krumholzibacteriota bacterium]
MHMSDALVSPAVGGMFWITTGVILWYCSRKLRGFIDSVRVPLMGVLGAFIFAAQMINFSIPGTGSSGHLGGGLLLAIILGPHAAFIVISSVLVVQALFFADGGILALGCNIFNMGFFPAFIAYPLIFKKMINKRPGKSMIVAAAVTASVVSLQLGAFSVVIETLLSGISSLPLSTFVLLMQPVHLAIGIVEGLVTAAVVIFVWNTRPEILGGLKPAGSGSISMRNLIAVFVLAAVVVGGAVSWFASSNPDGLEWAIYRTSGSELEAPEKSLYSHLAVFQDKTSIMPDYSIGGSGGNEEAAWPDINSETTIAGLAGGLLTLIFTFLISLTMRGKIKPSR